MNKLTFPAIASLFVGLSCGLKLIKPNGQKIVRDASQQKQVNDEETDEPFEVSGQSSEPTQLVGYSQNDISASLEKPFNAALVTSDVKCFFCHLKIEGNVAGINFPPRGDMHVSSARGLFIEGFLYATNTVPDTNDFNKRAYLGLKESYDNEQEKVFPSIGGKIQFPVFDLDFVRNNMKGTLDFEAGDGKVHIDKVYTGNLFIDGKMKGSLKIQGEVFIDGDLIIRGTYEGRGTIYARNIYIVDDLRAKNAHPPFPKPDLNAHDPFGKAMAAALEYIKDPKWDALYLAATRHSETDGLILVGDSDLNQSGLLVEFKTPYGRSYDHLGGPIDMETYESLGTPSARPSDNYGPLPIGEPGSNMNIDVSRVDAYLLAETLVWRAYLSLHLNGGFMAQRVVLLSNSQTSNGQAYIGSAHDDLSNHMAAFPWFDPDGDPRYKAAVNPRNGLSLSYNLISYDFRLRAGGPGYETVKKMFD